MALPRGRASRVAALFAASVCAALAARAAGPIPAPPFPTSEPARWVGPPVTWEALRGKVVLLKVWTFG